MLESFDMHEPLLINSIGHSIGLLLFAGFLALVLRDKRRGQGGVLLPLTAGLALAWNAGSLFVLAGLSGLTPNSDLIASLSIAALSLLPAALLQLSLEGRGREVWMAGWALSAAAAALHLVELFRPDARLHEAAVWVIIAGFGVLTPLAMLTSRPSVSRARFGKSRIPVSMCLFLFAISFVHFSPGRVESAWSGEIALHHACIPLALYVLLQDYRFLLLDAFLRFVVNGAVASGFIVLAVGLDSRFQILQHARDNAFLAGVLLVATSLLVVLLGYFREQLQGMLTRVIFGRRDGESAVRAIRQEGNEAESEASLRQAATSVIASFVQASRTDVQIVDHWDERKMPGEPLLLTNGQAANLSVERPWAEACVPVRFLKGDGALLFLGGREGGRRYLSEDLQELGRLGTVLAEQVERFRSSEIHRLVSEAELRALQSQINPHFLFNSLNTLYGTIPREASEARRLALNLAEIFRYFLQSDRTLIPLAEEMQIVRSYLEVEKLRLGDKLNIEISIDEAAERALIPVLSIQPLVENAVKHGVAVRSIPGTVRLSARTSPDGVVIEVSDDGGGFKSGAASSAVGAGVGLDNVRQRLNLCFGESAAVTIASSERGSTIRFLAPQQRATPKRSEMPV